MRTTKIEWTDKTWNPVTGCSKLSTGCAHCYAETMAHRLKAMGVAKYNNGFIPTMHENTLDEPLKWKQPHTIFVCSMADLFHESIPFDFIDRVMGTIKQANHHRYQILTKRATRMAEYFSQAAIPENVWLGVTVEAIESKSRIEVLRDLPASVRFLSCEPLIEDLGDLDLSGIDWVIVGGESGVQARPMKPEWVRSIMAQTETQKVAFFFKQWGTWGSDGVKRNKKANGKALDGKIIQMMPELAMR
jgi:protein gp37